jgi:hypothetical protein
MSHPFHVYDSLGVILTKNNGITLDHTYGQHCDRLTLECVNLINFLRLESDADRVASGVHKYLIDRFSTYVNQIQLLIYSLVNKNKEDNNIHDTNELRLGFDVRSIYRHSMCLKLEQLWSSSKYVMVELASDDAKKKQVHQYLSEQLIETIYKINEIALKYDDDTVALTEEAAMKYPIENNKDELQTNKSSTTMDEQLSNTNKRKIQDAINILNHPDPKHKKTADQLLNPDSSRAVQVEDQSSSLSLLFDTTTQPEDSILV